MIFHLSDQAFEDLSVAPNKHFSISTESGELVAASRRNVKRLSCFNAPTTFSTYYSYPSKFLLEHWVKKNRM